MIINAKNINISAVSNNLKQVKKLSALDINELSALLDHNSDIKDKMLYRCLDSVYYFFEDITSYLRDIRAIDWNFGYPGSYMTVREEGYSDFLQACEKLQRVFGFFPDDIYKNIERAAAKISFYIDCSNGYEDISDTRYMQLEKWLKSVIDAAAHEIVTIYNNMEDDAYNKETQLCELEFWAGEYGDDLYIRL